jgi:hypothetical protein
MKVFGRGTEGSSGTERDTDRGTGAGAYGSE